MSEGAVIDRIVGRGVPVRGNDIDTDRIIPARYLREITFEGLGPHAFEDDRRALNGAHPLDDPRFADAGVMVVNKNFGCGSSREHAPQALLRRGIRAIVGESFAEIFFGNCVAIGLPCLTTTPEHADALQALLEEAPDTDLTVDVEAERVVTDHGDYPAAVPASAKASFLTGRWDALGQLLENTDEVRATSARLPYLTGFGGESS
ncbi:MAG: 3-isopropylmalate dehydratase small subunit [Chloroflexota bacterium]|nr:3-isopropylmalate dehydratase small subunit [Chloroflexota bacterium]